MTPPVIHIKVDPALTDDDSDELVAHKMPGGDLFIEIYQGPGFGTQHTQTTLKPEAINSLVKFIGWRSCMEGLRSTIYSGAMTDAELEKIAQQLEQFKSELVAIIAERDSLQSKLTAAEARAEKAERERKIIHAELDRLRKELEFLQARISDRIVNGWTKETL